MSEIVSTETARSRIRRITNFSNQARGRKAKATEYWSRVRRTVDHIEELFDEPHCDVKFRACFR